LDINLWEVAVCQLKIRFLFDLSSREVERTGRDAVTEELWAASSNLRIRMSCFRWRKK